MIDLANARCRPCEGGVLPLHADVVEALMGQVPAWQVVSDGGALERTFQFPNYYQVMAFVNAVAWVAHTQDHHPDLSVHYDRVVVHFETHAIRGLSENDFICAAKVDALLPG